MKTFGELSGTSFFTGARRRGGKKENKKQTRDVR